jgi:hypothetical protein
VSADAAFIPILAQTDLSISIQLRYKGLSVIVKSISRGLDARQRAKAGVITPNEDTGIFYVFWKKVRMV